MHVRLRRPTKPGRAIKGAQIGDLANDIHRPGGHIRPLIAFGDPVHQILPEVSKAQSRALPKSLDVHVFLEAVSSRARPRQSKRATHAEKHRRPSSREYLDE